MYSKSSCNEPHAQFPLANAALKEDLNYINFTFKIVYNKYVFLGT